MRLELVTGVDEAGRGALVGPVSIAAVTMQVSQTAQFLEAGVKDSKKLSADKRTILYNFLITELVDYKIVLVDSKTIDSINILQATLLGMTQCLSKLEQVGDRVLIDGNQLPECPSWIKEPAPKMEAIIKGDTKEVSIAAASILAKVSRDNYLIELHKKYPQFNFAKHKGYATKEHIANLLKYGKIDEHRISFLGKIMKTGYS